MEIKLSKEELDYIAKMVAEIISEKNNPITLREALENRCCSSRLYNILRCCIFNWKYSNEIHLLDLPLKEACLMSKQAYKVMRGMGRITLDELEGIFIMYGYRFGNLTESEMEARYK